MSKNNVEKILHRELEALNNTIDMKIIKGQSYMKEARQHKYLLARLVQTKRSRVSFFGRFSFVPMLFL